MALKQNLLEGVEQGVFHDYFLKKFEKLMDDHGLDKANSTVNVQDYPDIERSQAEIEMACNNMLKFGASVIKDWPKFAEYFGRTATSKNAHNRFRQLKPDIHRTSVADQHKHDQSRTQCKRCA